MENPEIQGAQNPPEEVVQISPAELAELRKKADASEQNFARLKKEEQARKEAEAKLAEQGENKNFDSSSLEKRVDEKVDLRLAGYTPEQISEIEKYARGAGINSLVEASKAPFIQGAVEAERAAKKSLDSNPAPSARIKTFNGKPVDEIFKSGSPAEKQAAFEARMSGGVKSE